MSTEPVLLDFAPGNGIATITFNRPDKYNALDEAMAKAFHQAVATLAGNKALRCIILRGAGKAFMAGGDIAAFAADPERADQALQHILRHIHPALLTLQTIDAPVIAAVHGPAAGAGLSLVLSADYAICSPSAKFILAYDKLATVPDCGGSWFLRQKLGLRAAFALMLRGDSLDSEAAKSLGIVSEIFAETEFDAELAALAGRIAAGPTRAFALFKRLMAQDLPLAAQLEMEKSAFMEASYSEDFKQAVANFINKKPTHFKGL